MIDCSNEDCALTVLVHEARAEMHIPTAVNVMNLFLMHRTIMNNEQTKLSPL